jgi:peptidoglycan-associated lipoprotein
MRKLFAVGVVATGLLLAACPTKRAPTQAPVDPNAQTGTTPGAEASGVDSATAAAGEPAAGPQGEALSKRVIYFDFDRDEIRPDDAAVVTAHGRYLANNPGIRVRLEGHADERGSREYNIGLGERRAQAVRRALLLQGTTEPQLATVSFGEERPAVAGSDESAWARNRRVEIVYIQ